jgi:hypothetical protein
LPASHCLITYVGIWSVVDVVQDASIVWLVPSGERDAWRICVAISSNINIKANWIELSSRGRCSRALWVSGKAEVKSNELMTNDILPRLDIGRNRYSPGVVVLDKNITASVTSMWIVRIFINLEEFDLLWYHIWFSHSSHILIFINGIQVQKVRVLTIKTGPLCEVK